MPPGIELGVYISSAKLEAISKVANLMAKGGVFVDSIPQIINLDQLPERIVVAGGERSNRTLFQAMYDRDQLRPIAVAGGGTNNVLYEFLVKSGRVMTAQEFFATPVDNFPERFIYRPGMASNETGKIKIIFNNLFGIGNFDTAHGIIHEWLRGFPPKVRSIGSSWLATIPAVLKEGKILDLYSVARNIGEVDAFPHQDQFGDFVTHATTDGSLLTQAKSRLVVQESLRHNRIPPQENLWIDQGRIFSVRNKFSHLWVDGDTVDNPFMGNSIIIGRADKGVPLVALVN